MVGLWVGFAEKLGKMDAFNTEQLYKHYDLYETKKNRD
jgi:hypothetical protein